MAVTIDPDKNRVGRNSS